MSGAILLLAASLAATPREKIWEGDSLAGFEELLGHKAELRPELVGVHPRVFVTEGGLAELRVRARSTHRERWQRVLAELPALRWRPPRPVDVLDRRRALNDVAYAIAGAALAWAVERKAEYREAAKQWTLAALDYEPWGYTFSKPNVDLAAGHLLYAVGWAYDLLYEEWTPAERERVRGSLERHARLVYERFTPGEEREAGGRAKTFQFTQNHNSIPTAGLAVAALALMGESPEAPRWAALARAHNLRALQLLSPDGCYYEGFEYWIFSAPWLVHFTSAWEHATGESFWDAPLLRNWKYYVAHTLLPDGQSIFDFGDAWEGALTRARRGDEYGRIYPGGKLQSNFAILWQVARKLRDPQTQAVAERLAALGHSNLEEYLTLLYRDATLAPAPMTEIPLRHHFADSGVVFYRTSWNESATAFAFKAGPPEGHRVAQLLARFPEWELESGHAHPDAASFIIWARGQYLVGDTGYAGLPSARDHNTITVGGLGQGHEGRHDVWGGADYGGLDRVRIEAVEMNERGARIVAEAAPAYPPEAGLESFKRSFELRAPQSFEISDQVALRSARGIEWHLHADQPFTAKGKGFSLKVGAVELLGQLSLPQGARIETDVAVIASPGRPGSIEQGRRDSRGYRLTVVIPPRERTSVGLAVQVR